METGYEYSALSVKHLLGQLNIARREINNLRQQIKSLRYIHEKEVDDIKKLLRSVDNGIAISSESVTPTEEVKPSTSTGNELLQLKPIGVISTWFPTKRGTPRQTGICGKVPGKLTLYNSVFTNPDHALEGLQDFSHMWILFHFHRNDSTHVRAKVAPPRLNGMRTGVFSTRSPHRPCPIGLSLVKITGIESRTIYFEGVDMVDQSPVLDIKPYIPQYDNPLFFEKFGNCAQETIINNTDSLNDIEPVLMLDRNETFNVDSDSSRRSQSLDSNAYHRENLTDVDHAVDVSRDEEIALRLQAEEFQDSITFDNFNTRVLSCGAETRLQAPAHRCRFSQNLSCETRSGLNEENVTSTNFYVSVLPTSGSEADDEDEVENLQDLNNRLHGIQVDGQTNPETAVTSSNAEDPNYRETHNTSRNSRLLDGADGPSTVCGTDSDLIHRRSLNSRIDNSPVRMGIREAPDGEEGLESQTITPSQTLYNIQTSRTTPNSNIPETPDATTITPTEIRSTENRMIEINTNEVRVPDWISRPRTPLTVVFNDRALIQLNEILGSKINDQKKAIENILREDPRSVYLRQRWGSQFYTFLIHELHITCRFDDNLGTVTVFQVRHAGRICECGEPEWQCLGHSPVS